MPNKPWLSSYPAGVPHEIDAGRYASLCELIDEAFAHHAERPMATCMGRTLRYRDVDQRADALAAWLQAQGVERGTRVALMMPNLLQYTVAIVAVLRCGGVVVNVNPLYTARELEQQLVDSGSEAIVVLENFAHTLAEVIARTPVRVVVLAALGDALGPWKGALVNFAVRHVKRLVPEFELPLSGGRSVVRFNAALERGSALHRRAVAVGPHDVAFLQYTGGTTGVSKGATLLHRNLVANILQADAWFEPVLRRCAGRPMTIVCALPMYHVFALTVCCLMGMRFGAENLLIPNPRDLAGLVETLRGHRFHLFPAVNTLFNALAHDAAFARLDFSSLVGSLGGGMAVQQSTAQRWLEVTGCPVVEGYGLSETSPMATANRLDVREFSGSIGLPLPSTELTIRDDAGRDLAPGEPGEICIRGPQVMAGYWQRPDETARVMCDDGYFRSGDIGMMDERGVFRIVDRKKDMVLVSGFNVYPTEIEQVVNLHPGVLESAAVGVPDARTGEAVKLFVVRRDPGLAETELERYCRDNFAAYKRPRQIEFRDELPKSNVGKILRRELRG